VQCGVTCIRSNGKEKKTRHTYVEKPNFDKPGIRHPEQTIHRALTHSRECHCSSSISPSCSPSTSSDEDPSEKQPPGWPPEITWSPFREPQVELHERSSVRLPSVLLELGWREGIQDCQITRPTSDFTCPQPAWPGLKHPPAICGRSVDQHRLRGVWRHPDDRWCAFGELTLTRLLDGHPFVHAAYSRIVRAWRLYQSVSMRSSGNLVERTEAAT
jgi:hypothetical protein